MSTQQLIRLIAISIYIILFHHYIVAAQESELPRCGVEQTINKLKKEDPQAFERMKRGYFQQTKKELQQYRRQLRNRKTTVACPNGITVIPIAFQVFHDGETIGSGHNWSEAQLQQVVDELNEAYGGYNSNKDIIPDYFQDVDAGNTCIQFCIGKISRMNCADCNFCEFGAQYYSMSNCPGMHEDPDDFLNIYSADLGSGLYGASPCIPGYFACSASIDGIYMHYDYLIPDLITVSSAKRTVIHEVGHWLGLPHIWGDIAGGGCGADDGFSDTPNTAQARFTCTATPPNTCGGGDPDDLPDMIFNYMDYAGDACYAMFTKEQAAKMQATLFGSRYSISTSAARGNCRDTLVCSTPNSSNTINLGLRPCDYEVNLLDIQNVWYAADNGFTQSGITSFHWSLSGVNGAAITEPADHEVIFATNDCNATESLTFTLTMDCWDMDNGTYSGGENAGTVLVEVEACERYCTAPTANFSPSKTALCPIDFQTLTFTNQSIGEPDTYNWTFSGAGVSPTTSTDAEPSVSITSAGTLTVSLTVSNAIGSDTNTQSFPITFLAASDPQCPNDCGSEFVDFGGKNANYLNNSYAFYTFCPSDPAIEVVEVDFSVFELEDNGNIGCHDYMTIYDGQNSNAPQIGGYFCDEPGGSGSPGVVTASNETGCLSFEFISDEDTRQAGWEAAVNCIPRPTCDDGIQNGDETGIDCGGECGTCTCGKTFIDSGGLNDTYRNNDTITYVFCPTEGASHVEVVFESFEIEDGTDAPDGQCWDFLEIYNGDNTNAPQIGSTWCSLPAGPGSPGTVTSTNPSGCLTFVFTSDLYVVEAGWEASVNCICKSSRHCLGVEITVD